MEMLLLCLFYRQTLARQALSIYVCESSSPLASAQVLSYISSKVGSFGATIVNYKQLSLAPTITTNYAYGASASYKTFLVAGIVIMVAAFGAMWSGGMTLLLDRQLGNLKHSLRHL